MIHRHPLPPCETSVPCREGCPYTHTPPCKIRHMAHAFTARGLYLTGRGQTSHLPPPAHPCLYDTLCIRMACLTGRGQPTFLRQQLRHEIVRVVRLLGLPHALPMARTHAPSPSDTPSIYGVDLEGKGVHTHTHTHTHAHTHTRTHTHICKIHNLTTWYLYTTCITPSVHTALCKIRHIYTVRSIQGGVSI